MTGNSIEKETPHVSPDRNIAPAIHEFGKLILAPDDEITLPNGIKLHIVSGSETNVCRLTIALPGGEAENATPGLMRILSRLLPEGTVSHTGSQLADRLEYNGAWIGCGTSTHYSTVNLHSLSERYASLLPSIYEIVTEPVFEEEGVAREIRATVGQLEVDRKKVAYIADCAARRAAYGEQSPLSRETMPDDIINITREDLLNVHAARIIPGRMHLYLSGNVTAPMIEETIRIFSGIKVSDSQWDEARLNLTPPSAAIKKLIDEPKGALQSAIKFFIPVPGRSDKDFIPLRMAVTALGGYFGSRLMMNVREIKGLTYGISASLIGYPEQGYVSISTQADCANVEAIENEVRMQLSSMADAATYTSEELLRLRRYMLSTLASVLDTPFSRMDFLQTRLFASTPADYYSAQMDALHSLTISDLAKYAERYFNPENLSMIVAGTRE